MGGDGGVDEVAAQAPQARKRPLLVGAGEPTVSDDIRNQNRRELPGFRHGAPRRLAQYPTAVAGLFEGE